MLLCICVILILASILARGRTPKWMELEVGGLKPLIRGLDSLPLVPGNRLFFVLPTTFLLFLIFFLFNHRWFTTCYTESVCEIEARHAGPDTLGSIKAADFQPRIHTTTCSFIWSTTAPLRIFLKQQTMASKLVSFLNFKFEFIWILNFNLNCVLRFLRFWSPCSSLLSWLLHRLVPDSWQFPSKTSSFFVDLLLIQHPPGNNNPFSASAAPPVIDIWFFL